MNVFIDIKFSHSSFTKVLDTIKSAFYFNLYYLFLVCNLANRPKCKCFVYSGRHIPKKTGVKRTHNNRFSDKI